MIIINTSSPNKSLYVIGAYILKELPKNKFIDPLELYTALKTSKPNISINYFYFALDWLFIIDLISLTEEGDIKLCN